MLNKHKLPYVLNIEFTMSRMVLLSINICYMNDSIHDPRHPAHLD